MTRSTFVRICMLFAVLLCAVPALAQEPLTLPAAPETAAAQSSPDDMASPEFVFLIAQPLWPVDNGLLYYGNVIEWTNVSATSYALKVKVVETGHSFTIKPTYTCTAVKCTASSQTTELFDHVRDGQHIKWQVITNIAGSKFKSTAFSAEIDELDLRAPLTPADGAALTTAGFTSMKWERGYTSINLGYRLVVKDQATGKTVLNRLFAAGGPNCTSLEDTCAIQITADETTMVFQTGRTYAWTVTYIGRSGEQAKSVKRTFTLQ